MAGLLLSLNDYSKAAVVRTTELDEGLSKLTVSLRICAAFSERQRADQPGVVPQLGGGDGQVLQITAVHDALGQCGPKRFDQQCTGAGNAASQDNDGWIEQV